MTHLEPDILKSEVKWALEKSLRAKLVEEMEFQLSYFKVSKMMLLKCCTENATKFGKPISDYRTGKGQFSFQYQRRAIPKNVQTTAQLHSFHMLARSCSKSFKLGFNSTWTENFQSSSWIRKSKGTRDHIANIHWITGEAREVQKNLYFCFIDYAKAFDCVDHNKLWKILKEVEIPDHPTCLLRNMYAG